MSPGRDAAGIRMPTLEGLLTHTHRLHVNTGPILSPRHSSSWRLWPFCPLTTAPNTVQDTKGLKFSYTAPGDGGGVVAGRPRLPLCSQIVRCGFLSLAQLSSPNRQTHRENSGFLFLPGHPDTLALSCSGQGHSLASRSTPNHSLDGIPKAACAQKKNASCSAFERRPRPTRTTREHPASPSRLPPATLETHAKGPSSQPWACQAHPHSRTQMLLHHT